MLLYRHIVRTAKIVCFCTCAVAQVLHAFCFGFAPCEAGLPPA